MEALRINGTERQFAAGEFPATLADLLTVLSVDAATVVAELDGDIVERVKFGSTKLRSGQRLELVRFVPGG